MRLRSLLSSRNGLGVRAHAVLLTIPGGNARFCLAVRPRFPSEQVNVRYRADVHMRYCDHLIISWAQCAGCYLCVPTCVGAPHVPESSRSARGF